MVFWQYCKDLKIINDVLDSPLEYTINWPCLESADQIISITYDPTEKIYVVFWRAQ